MPSASVLLTLAALAGADQPGSTSIGSQIDALIEQANQYGSGSRDPEAARLWDRVLALNPRHGYALVERGLSMVLADYDLIRDLRGMEEGAKMVERAFFDADPQLPAESERAYLVFASIGHSGHFTYRTQKRFLQLSLASPFSQVPRPASVLDSASIFDSVFARRANLAGRAIAMSSN